jgi:hypothetical protein
MARDVEVDVTANDRTGSGLSSVERAFKRTSDTMKKEQDRNADHFGRALSTTLTKIAPKLAATLTKSMDTVSDAAGPALAAGIIAVTPMIASTLQAAVVGGAGIGGVIGGLVLASRDARVQASGKQLGRTLLGNLEQDAAPFIEPVLKAISSLQEEANRLDPVFKRIFASASRYVAPLTEGLINFVDPVIRGFERLVAKAGPVIESIKNGLGKVGVAIGNAFGMLSENSDAAAHSLDSVFGTIAGLIDIIAPTVAALTKLNGWLDKVGLSGGAQTFEKLSNAFGSGAKNASQFSSHVAGTAEALSAAADDSYDYAAGLAAAEEAVRGVFDANRDLYSSTTSVAQAFSDASKAAKENGRTLALDSKEGRGNREALSNVANALQRNYDGYVKVNGAGAGAAALAATLRGRFVALAQKLGASAGQASKLADQLLGIPNVKRRVDVDTARAKANAADLAARLAGIHDRQVRINVVFNQSRINKVQAQLDRIGASNFAGPDGGAWQPGAGAGSRTGGPAPVTVQSHLQVSLDGEPFRQMIASSERRQSWRASKATR